MDTTLDRPPIKTEASCDLEKIARIKKTLHEGNYHIDANNLAEKILSHQYPPHFIPKR